MDREPRLSMESDGKNPGNPGIQPGQVEVTTNGAVNHMEVAPFRRLSSQHRNPNPLLPRLANPTLPTRRAQGSASRETNQKPRAIKPRHPASRANATAAPTPTRLSGGHGPPPPGPRRPPPPRGRRRRRGRLVPADLLCFGSVPAEVLRYGRWVSRCSREQVDRIQGPAAGACACSCCAACWYFISAAARMPAAFSIRGRGLCLYPVPFPIGKILD